MANWNLAEKQIYKLLKHPFQKEKSDIEVITAVYLEFVEELFDYLNKENDNKTRIRQLNMSYIDFGTIKALEETSPTENSKLKIIYLDKLLSLINMEQELIYRQMEYPKFFINIESDWKSPFYLNSEYLFPPKIRRNLSPHSSFPFEDLGGIFIFVEPFFCTFDKLENLFVDGCAFKQSFTFLFLHP